MEWKIASWYRWILVTPDGEIVDEIYLDTFRQYVRNGKRYISLEAAKSAPKP